jgi:hypothetical protein
VEVIVRNPTLYTAPQGNQPPPWWIRGILVLTCTGVSFAHGSNDGQKGMGLIMLIVCGLGQTMRQAQAQAYSRIRNIMIPDMYYRDDIGERWFEDHDRLHTWGYLREI